jgi:hypothetical protein
MREFLPYHCEEHSDVAIQQLGTSKNLPIW